MTTLREQIEDVARERIRRRRAAALEWLALNKGCIEHELREAAISASSTCTFSTRWKGWGEPIEDSIIVAVEWLKSEGFTVDETTSEITVKWGTPDHI